MGKQPNGWPPSTANGPSSNPWKRNSARVWSVAKASGQRAGIASLSAGSKGLRYPDPAPPRRAWIFATPKPLDQLWPELGVAECHASQSGVSSDQPKDVALGGSPVPAQQEIGAA